MAAHIQKINDFVNQLTAISEPPFDAEIRIILICFLLTEYSRLVTSFSTQRQVAHSKCYKSIKDYEQILKFQQQRSPHLFRLYNNSNANQKNLSNQKNQSGNQQQQSIKLLVISNCQNLAIFFTLNIEFVSNLGILPKFVQISQVESPILAVLVIIVG